MCMRACGSAVDGRRGCRRQGIPAREWCDLRGSVETFCHIALLFVLLFVDVSFSRMKLIGLQWNLVCGRRVIVNLLNLLLSQCPEPQ